MVVTVPGDYYTSMTPTNGPRVLFPSLCLFLSEKRGRMPTTKSASIQKEKEKKKKKKNI
jgi:hypothetical protein